MRLFVTMLAVVFLAAIVRANGLATANGIETVNSLAIRVVEEAGEGGLTVPEDYLHYWKFDGDVTDEAGTQNWTINGSPSLYEDGGPDGRGHIDMNHNYLSCGLTSAGSTWSFGCWMRYDGAYSAGHNLTLGKQGGDYAFSIYNIGAGVIQANIDGYYLPRSGDMGWENSPYTWMHFVVVSSGSGTLALYKNGSYNCQLGNFGTLDYNRFSHYGGHVKAQCDFAHAILYNSVLSTDDIEQLYEATGGDQ